MYKNTKSGLNIPLLTSDTIIIPYVDEFNAFDGRQYNSSMTQERYSDSDVFKFLKILSDKAKDSATKKCAKIFYSIFIIGFLCFFMGMMSCAEIDPARPPMIIMVPFAGFLLSIVVYFITQSFLEKKSKVEIIDLLKKENTHLKGKGLRWVLGFDGIRWVELHRDYKKWDIQPQRRSIHMSNQYQHPSCSCQAKSNLIEAQQGYSINDDSAIQL